MTSISAIRGNSCLSHSSSGFTLIEVMVSLVLLAGGLLSVAYMQTYSLQFGQESYHRGQTLVSTNELIESMRSMQIASDDDGGSQVAYTGTVSAAEAAAGCDVTVSSMRNDLICFQQEVSRNLPYGTATVAVNATDTRYYDITVYWSDRGLSEQAGFSNADTAEASVNLNNAAACNASNNRIWSTGSGITWPFDNGPDTALCLVSHTYSVQILDPTTL